MLQCVAVSVDRHWSRKTSKAQMPILVCVLQRVAVCCSVRRQTLKPQDIKGTDANSSVCVLQRVAVCCSVRRQTLKPQDIKGTDANSSVCRQPLKWRTHLNRARLKWRLDLIFIFKIRFKYWSSFLRLELIFMFKIRFKQGETANKRGEAT